LRIDWGTVTDDLVKGTGTFHETWSLRWRPELAVDIIDAAIWGTTVLTAASARIADAAANATELAAVSTIVERVLLADLPDALGPVLRALDARAAADSDVADLMTAVPALVRAIRYGTVRGTATGALATVVHALTARVCAGLPGAVGGLADDAALALRSALDGMHAALALYATGGANGVSPLSNGVSPRPRGEDPPFTPLPRGTGTERPTEYPLGIPAAGPGIRQRWLVVLASVASRRDVHGLIAGRVTRLLADAGALPWPEAATRLRAALSAGVPAAGKAAWAEGFLSGGGLLLVHDRDLLAVLDAWVASLGEEEFLDVAPLLRRVFGEFSAPERASIGTAVRQLPGGPGGEAGPDAAAGAGDVDHDRAAAALATVELILGGAR
jgi:hypothetical protein